MDLDTLQGLGFITLAIIFIMIIIFILLCPLIVAILIANTLSLTGIYWWAVVLVSYMIIDGIIAKLTA